MDNTKQFYLENAQDFFDSTVMADMSSLYAHFLKYIPKSGKILDLGCGSGRDAKFFIDNGYNVDAIDGSEELCKLASKYAGINVRCMDFMDLEKVNYYDAIWACASLLHVPCDRLPFLFAKLKEALSDEGIIYMSFKNGDFEGERDGRYFTDMTTDKLSSILSKINSLKVVEEWYSEDVRSDKNCTWYNVIIGK